jgi:RNA polymerase sigma factor (sigma-70 family)
MQLDSDILDQYRTRLRWKVCHHLGSFCPDVDDVVQESISRLLAAARDDKIRNPESLGAFLSGICNNVISEYRRRLWKEPLAEPEMPERAARASSHADAFAEREAITTTLAEMSDRDCRLLRAFYLEEADKEDICHREGVSDGQFRVALFRAKERFRKIYGEKVKRRASGGH